MSKFSAKTVVEAGRLDPRVQSPDRSWEHWKFLCEDLGDRRAGSANERAAADYLVRQFNQAGLTNAHSEAFPCRTVKKAEAKVVVRIDGRSESVIGRVLAGSPGTRDGDWAEGELVWIEMPEQAERFLTPALSGKVVVLVGPTPTRADHHRLLVKSQPAAVLHLDDRLPFDWDKADGVYPTWVRRFGMPPIASVPFQVGWRWRKQRVNRARVRIRVELRDSESQNVVADVAGRRPDLPMVVLGAHHDTQCDNVGADDNASGVVALLSVAERLARRPALRTVRFVSFGAEEQLSVGSAVYVKRHRRELSTIGAVLNLDSVASPLGHHWLVRAGTSDFGRCMRNVLRRCGMDVVEQSAPMPFADHFPFSVYDVPSFTLYRPNMDSGMRWQHHSPHDNLDNVSEDQLGHVVQAMTGLASWLAAREKWPFDNGQDPEQRAETVRLAKDLFDLRG